MSFVLHYFRSFFVLTDSEPYDALRTLDNVFPSAPKFGVVGAWTPFLTGRPHFLFVNDRVFHSGMVGIGYGVDSHVLDRSEHYGMVHHWGVEELEDGGPFEITK